MIMLSHRRIAVGALVLSSVYLSGCINLVPVPRMGEKEEAKAQAKIFRSVASDAKEQLIQEHGVARALKITLDEMPTLDPGLFREKFAGYKDQLISIRNHRRQIVETLRQALWQSPLVFVVQQDAINLLLRDINRTQSWIELADSIRLRSDLGRKTDFPEIALLSHQLETFLAETSEDPLGNQLRALQEEFRFGDAEIGS